MPLLTIYGFYITQPHWATTVAAVLLIGAKSFLEISMEDLLNHQRYYIDEMETYLRQIQKSIIGMVDNNYKD